MASSTCAKDEILSPRQIEGLISDGHLIVIADQRVLKLDSWVAYHPGGELAIRHVVGRDATDEVNAFHSTESRNQMGRYQIGKIEGRWTDMVPPVQGGKFRKYVEITSSSLDVDFSYDLSRTQSTVSSSSSISDATKPSQRRRAASDSSATSISSTSSVPDDTIAQFHEAETKRAIEHDIARYPSLDFKTQDNITAKYRALEDRMYAEGLFNCNYTAYYLESLRYFFIAGMMLLCLKWEWYAVSGMFLGTLWHQLVFTVHDAGHLGITHHYLLDTVIGMTIANHIGGLSLGWWKRMHNVHHIVTNAPEHDPDIEHLPFFAISHKFFSSLKSTYYDRILPFDAFAKMMLPYQAYTYYIILAFGRFNLYFLSWEHIIRGLGPRKGEAQWHRWYELSGQLFFWFWFGYLLLWRTIPGWHRVVFVLASHMITMPLHVQFTLSHFAMSTSDLGPHESFPQKQLRTTMDVDCPHWLDFLHGGLQFQAIHHLYPRLPRHNLRRAQKLVQEFCVEVEIPYALYGFVEGNKNVLGHLSEISKQAKIFAECQRSIIEKGDILSHSH